MQFLVTFKKFSDDNLQNQFISAQNSPNESKPTTSIQKLEPIQLETFFFDKDSNEIDEFVNLLNDDQCHPCISHDLKLVLFNTIKESLIKSAEFQRMLGLFDKFQNSHTAMTDLLSMIGQVFVQINKHEWSSWISALEYYMQHRHLMAQVKNLFSKITILKLIEKNNLTLFNRFHRNKIGSN